MPEWTAVGSRRNGAVFLVDRVKGPNALLGVQENWTGQGAMTLLAFLMLRLVLTVGLMLANRRTLVGNLARTPWRT
jgi:hypothetical protein